METFNNIIQNFDIVEVLYTLPAIVLSLTVHEYSHALSAKVLGDDTAQKAGRLSLNPFKHIDPIGFIFLIIAHFGWAKPVPINPRNFKKPKRDEIIVSLAGPLSNIILALIFSLIMRAFIPLINSNNIDFMISLYSIISYFVQINVVLCIFNMFPIPPLDGSHIIMVFIPMKWQYKFYKYMKYSNILFILLFVSGLGSILIQTPAQVIYDFLLKYVVGI